MANVTLTIFKDINPNTKGSIYYVYDDASLFYSKVLIAHTIGTINENDFRINRGTIIVAGNADSYAYYRKSTYAMERIVRDSGATPCMIFYHIQKVRYECGKIYMDVAIDDFANGMQSATFSNVHVSRTSRGNLDSFFDSRNITYDGTFLPYGNYDFDDSESSFGYGIMHAVAKIDMVVSKDGFGNNAITRSAYFAFDAYDMIAKYNSMNKTPADWLTKIQDMLGGAFEGTCLSSTSGEMQQMKCSSIYVVPATWIPAINSAKLGVDTTYNDINLHIKSSLTGYTGFLQGHSVIPSHYEFEYGYALGRDAIKSVPFFGTRGQWMELPRRYKFGDVYIVCDASTGGIQIKAKQGSNEVDMTNAFVLPCSFQNDIDTESVQAQKGVMNAINVVTNIFKKGSKGDGVGAGLGFMKDVVGLMDNNNSKANSTDGNAFITYCPKMGSAESQDDYFTRVQTKWITNPVTFGYVTDIADGDAYVRENGVATDESYSNKTFLSKLASMEYLGDIDVTSVDDTYVRANLSVSGIPEQERTAIENAFKEGIRYVYVQSSSE